MKENYLTIIFKNGRTITRRADHILYLGLVQSYLEKGCFSPNDVWVNWSEVLCVRAATPIEIEAEKQREGIK